ncbi:putative m protein repeat protein [Erysiphe neolycopersici]|uniref:Putative m protein repeat protein n=1 Tax=Erysiphe neolycopersici TaxID=212602 RepID=A0A420HYJ4_9PEZI|nr:putative m protein repeat protein [Erysiphe neolycopersici]
MTAPSQHVSRWGSLFQQAVAGVESRLDNILADGAEENPPTQVISRSPKLPPAEVSSNQQISTPKLVQSGCKSNERLQERLARAVSSKRAASKEPAYSFPLGLASTSAVEDICRIPCDVSGNSSIAESNDNQISNKDTMTSKDDGIEQISTTLSHAKSEEIEIPEMVDIKQSSSFSQGEKVSSDIVQQCPSELVHENTKSLSFESLAEEKYLNSSTIRVEHEVLIKKLQSEIADLEKLRQEDSYSYTEKIDALQSKLQYMAKEASERAKFAGNMAPSGSLEKKLADKEHQMALLLEEGLSLSKKELVHLATIKKLRTQLQEENKQVNSAKRIQEVAKKEAIYAEERLKKIQVYEKQIYDQQNLITQLRNDLKLSQTENTNNSLNLKDLKTRLNEYIMRDTQADTVLVQNSLQAEKKRVAELEVEKANLETEKISEANKAEINIRDLKLLIHKNEQRALAKEKEMKTELQILESKLEATRKRAEEASSGVTGDTQARLLRQIETLQTQYSVASENWQGIEASLMAKVFNLEKEKDEAIRKEIDSRRKAREAVQKVKYTEEELNNLRARISTFQQEISGYKLNCEALKKQAIEAESKLKSAKISFDQESQALKLELQNHLAEEKQKWNEEIWTNNSPLCSRRDSSIISKRKSLNYENIGPQSNPNRSFGDHSVIHELTSTSHLINKFSIGQVTCKPSGTSVLSKKNSRASLQEKIDCVSPNPDPDEFSENSFTSCPSLHNTQEFESNSTIGAGLSVQLVERMSLAVRRLECEKVAMQEDIARISAQRDEAREEIINLMPEVEAKKNAEIQIKELEKELGELKMRYETTLVMLGEKSEEIDELKGDIQDIKTMYRDLVEKTVK